MIKYRSGDILSQDSEALVNTVNCVGVMGRGVALQFKNAYPENFKAYEAACKRGEVQPGRMLVFKTNTLTNPKYIINFPTKRHWRQNSKIEDIESGLKALVREIKERGIRSIAIPPLGSGLGGLYWPEVRGRIQAALEEVPNLQAVVFEPIPRSMTRSQRPKNVPKMTAGRAALIGLMHRYLVGLMEPYVTLLEVHKLMYFMQCAGQPLKLNYKKALYGPYAENLGHVLKTIEGHLVQGYADGGDAPGKLLELFPGAVEKAEEELNQHGETRQRFERVVDLVQGFETPFGLELLSTVHWVVTIEGAKSPTEAIKKAYAWNKRKRQFSERQLTLAFDVLAEKGWVQKPLC